MSITYRQLDYWARTGLLHPSITEAHGSGSRAASLHRSGAAEGDQTAPRRQGVAAGGPQGDRLPALRRGRPSLGEPRHRRPQFEVLAYSGEEIIDLLQGSRRSSTSFPSSGVVSELAAAITDLGLEPPISNAAGPASSSSPNGSGGPGGLAAGTEPDSRSVGRGVPGA